MATTFHKIKGNRENTIRFELVHIASWLEQLSIYVVWPPEVNGKGMRSYEQNNPSKIGNIKKSNWKKETTMDYIFLEY